MHIDKYITSSCLISKHSVYKNDEVLFVNKDAEANDFFISVYKNFNLNYSRFYKMDRLSKLGWLASEILLKDSFRKEIYKPEDIGLVLSNANSSIDTDQKYMASINDIPSPALFVYTLPNIVIGEICIRNNFKGENAFFLFNGFNAYFIENYVADLLENGIMEACICGWVELLGNEFVAALFLVEKLKGNKTVVLSKEYMEKIFKSKNIGL